MVTWLVDSLVTQSLSYHLLCLNSYFCSNEKKIVKVTLFRMKIKLPAVNRKDFAISIQQKCDEFHKPRRTNINFDEIALIFKNLVPNTTSIQLFNYVHNFPQLKSIFLWLEIERLGKCRLCFLSKEIRSNVNANSWIKNEQNSSVELFLWFSLAYLWFHYLDMFQEFLII